MSIIEGRGGISLYDYWTNGLRTFHGMMSRNFPNIFFTGFTQGGTGANITATYDQQARHISYIVKTTLAGGVATVEPSEESEAAWVKIIKENLKVDPKYWRECTPGYFNNEGAEEVRPPFGEPYGLGFYAFDDLIRKWRVSGDMVGMVLGN